VVDVSVIVSVYNGEKYLERCLTSIVNTGREDLEICIVDDGSTDGSGEVIRAFAARHSGRISVQSLHHAGHANKGVSASRNLGVRKAVGEYICFLDADDLFEAHRFDRCLAILDNNPNIDGVVEGVRIDTSESEEDAVGANEICTCDKSIPADRFLREGLVNKKCCVLNYNYVVRKAIFEKTGGYDERRRLSEDFHLWLRLAAVGRFRVGEVDKPVIVYRRHGGNTWDRSQTTLVRDFSVVADVMRWARTCPFVHADVLDVLNDSLEDKFKFACLHRDRHHISAGQIMKMVGILLGTNPGILAKRSVVGTLVRNISP